MGIGTVYLIFNIFDEAFIESNPLISLYTSPDPRNKEKVDEFTKILDFHPSMNFITNIAYMFYNTVGRTQFRLTDKKELMYDSETTARGFTQVNDNVKRAVLNSEKPEEHRSRHEE